MAVSFAAAALAVTLSAHPLKYDLTVDAAVTGGIWAAWLSTETVLKGPLAPDTCRWCDRNPDGSDALNPVDAWGRGLRAGPEQLSGVSAASDLVAFVAVPAAAWGLDAYLASSDGEVRNAPIDFLLVLEATGCALAFNQAVKFLAGRERPFVHALPESEKALTKHPNDNNLSFFSGHSTFAFAFAVGTGTVAHLRGYPKAWLIWAVALPIAAGAPLLRMAADRHYLTDVLVGSAVGAAFGWGIPTLFHGRAEGQPATRLRILPAPGGLAVAGRF
jgi:membrane-associated phospholipid phosphatase